MNNEKPKLWFSKEYSTTWLKEKLFLDSCGVRYTFVKIEDGKTTFKYKKTSELFNCLSKFYEELNIVGADMEDRK